MGGAGLGKAGALVLSLGLVLGSARAAAEPRRLADALPLPERLELSGEHRTRFEHTSDRFRAGRRGSDQILVARTLLLARLRLSASASLVAELMDSRAGLDDASTPVNTGIVNATDWLQAHLELADPDLFGGSARVRLGRMTLDVGDRRLVARNRFRNTINAFTGLDVAWTRGDHTLRGFYTLPVQRRPTAQADLRDNDAEADRESLDVIFWGLYGQTALPRGHRGETFFFGLHEQDASDRPTANRELYTHGVRVWKPPIARAFDYQLESVFQWGHSRASAASVSDLDHRAHFHHAELGYSFAKPGSPRVILQYDYASGDGSAADGDNGRFDTLFGARRFDFGPTGIWGPFARTNLQTPGIRFTAKAGARVTAMLAYRAFWLASDNDAWTTSGLADPSGASGDFVATQLELRLRFAALPGNLRLEGGLAWLHAEEFADDAPGSPRFGRALYTYLQAAVRF